LESPKIFVAIAGNIGTGKTTLTRLLSEKFGWDSHFEAVANNPYLGDFYADMDRWSFPLQIFFLNNRFKAHQKITAGMDSAIQDRCIYEDANIFARNLYEQGQMEERDYRNYLELYETMCQFLTPPDLIIYLRKTLPNLKSQILKRGRDYEANIPDAYLSRLNDYYDDWLDRYALGKKLIIESDDMDFIAHPEHFDVIVRKINAALDQQDLFFHSDYQDPEAKRRMGFSPGVTTAVHSSAESKIDLIKIR